LNFALRVRAVYTAIGSIEPVFFAFPGSKVY
jgi:hypothetical protein